MSPRGLKDWSGFVIGGTLGLAVMCIAPLTGAGFNPARAFGPALVGHAFDGAGQFFMVYIVGPLLGAVVAVILYAVIVETPGKREPGGAEPVG